MGTEIFNLLFNISLFKTRVKLNNPLMGTEIGPKPSDSTGVAFKLN